jgi:K+-sensing histidine kinase KdpD
MNTEFNNEHDQLLHRVFSSVAHDFKTPLACVIGSLGILNSMGEKLSPKKRDALIKNALSEANKLDAVITAMLDNAKV